MRKLDGDGPIVLLRFSIDIDIPWVEVLRIENVLLRRSLVRINTNFDLFTIRMMIFVWEKSRFLK